MKDVYKAVLKVQLLQPDCSDVAWCSLGSSALAPVVFWSFLLLLVPVVGDRILVRGGAARASWGVN